MNASKLDLREAETLGTKRRILTISGRLASVNSKVTPNVAMGNYKEILNDGSRRGSLTGCLPFFVFQLTP